ncbi:MAG: ParB/RepB/Spo0J family partition protein [Oscillospiraceae bacterium]|jgi:ParB family chromosome partitioning protein|nr:ParB/RepB/Spo0J family partition protein [Oscillospiraceae bacterium]
MAAKKSGLGRGLDSLFEDNGIAEGAGGGAVTLRMMDVEPNRDQPRRHFDETALVELAKSVADHGILQPILVRPMPSGSYQIVAGERRWRAARAAGLAEIPAVIREMTDEEAMAAALIENLQREDLNPMEEAMGYRQLMDSCGLTQEEAARRLGKSRPVVANALRLLKLPEPIAELVREGQLSAGHARALLALEQDTLGQELLATQIIAQDMSVREAEDLVRGAIEAQRTEAALRALETEGNGRTVREAVSRRPAYFDEVELSLAQALGRKIKVVTSGKEEAGRLVIDFYEKADLTRIVQALAALEE